jgi:hypothetical protein
MQQYRITRPKNSQQICLYNGKFLPSATKLEVAVIESLVGETQSIFTLGALARVN